MEKDVFDIALEPLEKKISKLKSERSMGKSINAKRRCDSEIYLLEYLKYDMLTSIRIAFSKMCDMHTKTNECPCCNPNFNMDYDNMDITDLIGGE